MKLLPKNNSGQALLLVLLSLAVVLTVALSVVSRSVTDISVATTSENSLRAFSAAEAGLEKALITSGLNESDVSLGNDAAYSVTSVGFGAGAEFIYPATLLAGEDALVWLVSQDGLTRYTGNAFKLCWGNPAAGEKPAIEVSIYYQDPGMKVFRAAYDPDSGRRASNSFSSVGGGGSLGGSEFSACQTVNFGTLPNLEFARVKFLYNTSEAQPLGVAALGSSFPAQGTLIASQGTSGQANRRVEVVQGFAEPSDIFSSAVFGWEGVAKE